MTFNDKFGFSNLKKEEREREKTEINVPTLNY
jgi:hypothetical protein